MAPRAGARGPERIAFRDFSMARVGAAAVQLDLAFLMDATFSMAPMFEMVGRHVKDWVKRISSSTLDVDVNVALVTYTDYGERVKVESR